jgi:hypothetical protein
VASGRPDARTVVVADAELDRVDATRWADNPGVSTSDPIADGPLVDRLRALHEHYVDAVNRAVAADRDDLVAELVADYPDEALALIAPGQVDIQVSPLPSTTRGRSVVDRCRAARWISAVRAAMW